MKILFAGEGSPPEEGQPPLKTFDKTNSKGGEPSPVKKEEEVNEKFILLGLVSCNIFQLI